VYWFHLYSDQSDIPLPNLEARKELLKINLRDVKLKEDVNLDQLAAKFEGYSGADITIVSWNCCFCSHFLIYPSKLRIDICLRYAVMLPSWQCENESVDSKLKKLKTSIKVLDDE
jgi:hypothetical protein